MSTYITEIVDDGRLDSPEIKLDLHRVDISRTPMNVPRRIDTWKDKAWSSLRVSLINVVNDILLISFDDVLNPSVIDVKVRDQYDGFPRTVALLTFMGSYSYWHKAS